MKLDMGALWGLFGIIYAASMFVVVEYKDHNTDQCQAQMAQYQSGMQAEQDYIKNLDDKYPAYKDNPNFGDIKKFSA